MECQRLGDWVPVGLYGFQHSENLFEGKVVVVLPSFQKSAPKARMQILPILLQRFGRGKLIDFSAGAKKRPKKVSADFVLVGDGKGHPGEILKDFNISVNKVRE